MAESILLSEIQGYTIAKKLGSGGYGTVYLGVKEDLGKQYQTAIKHISMPDAEAYESVLQDYNFDKAATQAHFEKLVAGITSEINTLLTLSKKDSRYIVTYYDHDIQKSLDPLRFEIFMRMEYLTPLNRAIRQKGMALGEVIKLGLNMCDALALCHNNDVMHRDIKEANIFVSETGNYKLGDFGVAKVAFESTQAGSIKGTASYMAPEIYLCEPYDKSVDIYSLGIVLYKLLNNQRLPFMPDAPTVFTADDKNMAESKRLKGEIPPLPFHAKNKLGEIIVKACSVKSQRYSTAEELKKELSAFIGTLSTEEYDTVIIQEAADGGVSSDSYSDNSIKSFTQTQGATMTMGMQSGQYATPNEKQNPYTDKLKGKAKKIVIAASILVGIVIAGAISLTILFNSINDPVNRFASALRKGDFSTVYQIYLDELRFGDEDKLDKAKQLLIDQAESIEASYVDNEIGYEEALAQIQEIENLKIVANSELSPFIESISKLQVSRTAYQNAQDHIEKANYIQAINELKKVIPRDENYDNAVRELNRVTSEYREVTLDEASALSENKEYTRAIKILEEAMEVIGEDTNLVLLRNTIKKQEIDEKIDEALALANGNEFNRAINILDQLRTQNPSDADISKALSDIEPSHVDNIVSEVTNLSANDNYDRALSTLNDGLRRYPNNKILADAITETQAKEKEYIIHQANTLAAEYRYDDAISFLRSSKYSNDSDIRALITDYNNRRPAILGVDILPYQSENIVLFTETAPGNMMGAQYIHGFRTDGSATSRAYFNLDGNYTNLSGLYGPMSGSASGNVTLTVWGDGKMLGRYEMATGDLVKIFNINVTDVGQLFFEFTGMARDRRYSIANVLVSTDSDMSASFNEPVGLYNSNPTLGHDIMAYRAENARQLSRAEPASVMGNSYDNGLVSDGFRESWSAAFYNIDGKYKSLTGIYGPLDGTNNAAIGAINIYGDGKLINTYTVRAGDVAQSFSVNVTGVTQIFIEVNAQGYTVDWWTTRYGRFVVANMKLSQ
ncbi:MAG: protein kinase [Oscillospiraceae bacterium]|nr:protein kinase [Oscillospiraceae bacterium]